MDSVILEQIIAQMEKACIDVQIYPVTMPVSTFDAIKQILPANQNRTFLMTNVNNSMYVLLEPGQVNPYLTTSQEDAFAYESRAFDIQAIFSYVHQFPMRQMQSPPTNAVTLLSQIGNIGPYVFIEGAN